MMPYRLRIIHQKRDFPLAATSLPPSKHPVLERKEMPKVGRYCMVQASCPLNLAEAGVFKGDEQWKPSFSMDSPLRCAELELAMSGVTKMLTPCWKRRDAMRRNTTRSTSVESWQGYKSWSEETQNHTGH